MWGQKHSATKGVGKPAMSLESFAVPITGLYCSLRLLPSKHLELWWRGTFVAFCTINRLLNLEIDMGFDIWARTSLLPVTRPLVTAYFVHVLSYNLSPFEHYGPRWCHVNVPFSSSQPQFSWCGCPGCAHLVLVYAAPISWTVTMSVSPRRIQTK